MCLEAESKPTCRPDGAVPHATRSEGPSRSSRRRRSNQGPEATTSRLPARRAGSVAEEALFPGVRGPASPPGWRLAWNESRNTLINQQCASKRSQNQRAGRMARSHMPLEARARHAPPAEGEATKGRKPQPAVSPRDGPVGSGERRHVPWRPRPDLPAGADSHGTGASCRVGPRHPPQDRQAETTARGTRESCRVVGSGGRHANLRCALG